LSWEPNTASSVTCGPKPDASRAESGGEGIKRSFPRGGPRRSRDSLKVYFIHSTWLDWSTPVLDPFPPHSHSFINFVIIQPS